VTFSGLLQLPPAAQRFKVLGNVVPSYMSTQQHTRAAAAAAAGGTNGAVSVTSTAAVIAAAGGVAPAPVERKADELQAVPECAGSSCLAVAAASVPYNAAAHSMARHDTVQQYSTMSVQQAETGRAGVRLANTTLIPTLHSTEFCSQHSRFGSQQQPACYNSCGTMLSHCWGLSLSLCAHHGTLRCAAHLCPSASASSRFASSSRRRLSNACCSRLVLRMRTMLQAAQKDRGSTKVIRTDSGGGRPWGGWCKCGTHGKGGGLPYACTVNGGPRSHRSSRLNDLVLCSAVQPN
jgi:hypothetical protein